MQREHAPRRRRPRSLQIGRRHRRSSLPDDAEPPLPENYLLSGDTREVDRMNDGVRTLNDKLQQGKALANSEQQRTALEKVQQLEQAWGKDFANPLIEKRKDVDSRQRHRGRTADLLSAERRFLLGQEFHRRRSMWPTGKPQTGGRAAPLR